ncbi:ABC-F family ATP-binding cassette domain-containing protein [Ilumatobacter sp.]|uniref:ABC-F family ATP-binding cassette domain-containing protein n=1 Tax=Ilumatobacter sp. TaxID=1967498 RepID=UPI003B51F698
MICVDASGVRVEQPDKVLFDDLDLTISRGDRIAVVGVNGSGKTTLLRVLTGALAPDAGVVRFGRGARITMLEQDPVLPAGTVAEHLGDGWEVASIATSLGVLGLFDRRTDALSGGQAKRVALARVLADNGAAGGGGIVDAHDVIVLDEPTNHLDLEAIEWLEGRLVAMSAALVLVTHDRHALDRLTSEVGPSRVVELDDGRAFTHQAAAGSSAYATYLDARSERIEREAKEESTRRILARQELAWLRRGAPARTSKPKARLRTAGEIVAGGPRDLGVRADDLELGAGTTRLGNQVVELSGVTQRFETARTDTASTDTASTDTARPHADATGERASSGGDPVTVLRDVDLAIEPGSRLAVVGPNGSGKTTLLDVVAGRRQPTEGTVTVGSTVVVGYADQHSSTLDPDLTVRRTVAGPLREPDHTDTALLERFWFDSTAQHAPVRMLSGGEKRRLQLVMVLARQPNLLVLDEPTNDLDLDTLRSLEEFLDGWSGALVVASHDRAFLDRVADHVLAIEPDGEVRRVPGGVSGWLDERTTSRGRRPSSRRSTTPRHTSDVSRASAPSAGRAGSGASTTGAPSSTASDEVTLPSSPTSTSGASAPARTSRDRGRRARTGPSPSTIGRRLRETEQAMVKAQRKVDSLNAELAATTDHVVLAERGEILVQAQGELDDLESAWLELAEQAES